MEHEPRFAHSGERNTLLRPLRVAEDGGLGSCRSVHSDDLDLDASAEQFARDVRAPSNEPRPVARGLEGPLGAGRGDFQDVSFCDRVVPIQPRLYRTRRTSAVVYTNLCSVAPVDANVEDRTTPRPASPKLDQIEGKCIKL